MRTLKFRAWDKEEKCWIPEKYLTMDLNGKIYSYDQQRNRYLKETIGYEIMQFTGLHDKNGKEIWEGDLLKTYNGVKTVTWSEDIGCFTCNDNRGLYGYLKDKEGAEVVGNMYEHNKLIKEPQ